MVVGGDEIVPPAHDRQYVGANQRHRYTGRGLGHQGGYENRYYLSDDYYAAVLPFSAFGREVYLPQFAIGRLV